MTKAYLEITMKVSAADRMRAGAVYSKYKDPFLAPVAESYLKSAFFGNDVVSELKPYLSADPEVRIYERQ
jgi:hypothetical protein